MASVQRDPFGSRLAWITVTVPGVARGAVLAPGARRQAPGQEAGQHAALSYPALYLGGDEGNRIDLDLRAREQPGDLNRSAGRRVTAEAGSPGPAEALVVRERRGERGNADDVAERSANLGQGSLDVIETAMGLFLHGAADRTVRAEGNLSRDHDPATGPGNIDDIAVAAARGRRDALHIHMSFQSLASTGRLGMLDRTGHVRECSAEPLGCVVDHRTVGDSRQGTFVPVAEHYTVADGGQMEQPGKVCVAARARGARYFGCQVGAEGTGLDPLHSPGPQ
jgi:hypothetical protein